VSYVSGYSNHCASAELASSRQCEKYAYLPNSYIFQPIAFENLGTLNSSAVALISAPSILARGLRNDYNE